MISAPRFFSVLVASQFGFLQADAIGGMIIAGYIFSVSYLSLKQSSLILVDAWQDPRVTELVKKVVEERFGQEQLIVKTVLLRPTGMVSQAEAHIEVDGNKPLKDVELVSAQIQVAIHSEIPNIERISVVPYAFTQKPQKKLRALFGSREWSQVR